MHEAEQVFGHYLYEKKGKLEQERFDQQQKAFKKKYLSFGHSNNFFCVKDHLYNNYENFYQLEIVIPQVEDRDKIPQPDNLANHKFMLNQDQRYLHRRQAHRQQQPLSKCFYSI